MMVGQDNLKVGYLFLLVMMIIVAIVNFLLLRRMEHNLPGDE
jgi:hypothetical protein